MSKLAANLVLVAPSHEFASAVGEELSRQLQAPLRTTAASLQEDVSGLVIVVTPDTLESHDVSRQLAAAGPAYSLVLPTDGSSALPSWCTPVNTVGRTPEAVAAEIMNDAANKHAVELDPIGRSRSGLSTTAVYVIIAVAAALLLFGCAAVFIGIPVGRAQEQVIFEDRGVAFEVEAATIEIVRGPPIPPPVEAPEADEYQPLAVMNETGVRVDNLVRSQFGTNDPGSATFVGVAVAREAEREVYTWTETFPEDGELECLGVARLNGGTSNCGPPGLDDASGPSLGWGQSSINNGPIEVDASISGLPDETRWVVLTTTTGWQIVTDNTNGLATMMWPEWEGIPDTVTAYDSDLNELWSGSF